MRRMICAAAAAAGLASAAHAQGGMTVDQIAAAAQGAPMNGGTASLTATTGSSGVKYYMGNIPNTNLQFALGGISCRTPAGAAIPCEGMALLFIAGSRERPRELFDSFNDAASYVKLYRSETSTMLVGEQLVAGAGPATVRAALVALNDGVAELVELLSAPSAVEIRGETPSASAADGPAVSVVLTEGLDHAASPDERKIAAETYFEAAYGRTSY